MRDHGPVSSFEDPPFAVTDRDIDNDTHVIELEGQVDLYSAPEFKERLLQVIESGKTRIVVDLSRVSFMDSTGLGVLVGALRKLRPVDGAIEVVSADPRIQSLFELTGLDMKFPLRDTCAEALRRLAAHTV